MAKGEEGQSLGPGPIIRHAIVRSSFFGVGFGLVILAVTALDGRLSAIDAIVAAYMAGLTVAPVTLLELGARRWTASRGRDVVTFVVGTVVGAAGLVLAIFQGTFASWILERHSLELAWSKVGSAASTYLVEKLSITVSIALAAGVIVGALAVARSRGQTVASQLARVLAATAFVACPILAVAYRDKGDAGFLVGCFMALVAATILVVAAAVAELIERRVHARLGRAEA